MAPSSSLQKASVSFFSLKYRGRDTSWTSGHSLTLSTVAPTQGSLWDWPREGRDVSILPGLACVSLPVHLYWPRPALASASPTNAPSIPMLQPCLLPPGPKSATWMGLLPPIYFFLDCPPASLNCSLHLILNAVNCLPYKPSLSSLWCGLPPDEVIAHSFNYILSFTAQWLLLCSLSSLILPLA